jgi:hypothetical protein
MSGIMYFVPGPSTIDEEKCKKLGLGYVMNGGPSFAGIQGDPTGSGKGPGVVFTFTEAFLQDAGKCVWEKLPDADIWAGYNPADPPKPADFAREKQIDGYPVELADGNQWLIPVARAIDGASPMPKRLVWKPEGWQTGDVLPAYKDLFGHACRVWDCLIGASETDIAIPDGADVAAMALAINYRLGRTEISLLGLFDTKSMGQVLRMLVEWPAALEIQKKILSGEITLPAGGQA